MCAIVCDELGFDCDLWLMTSFFEPFFVPDELGSISRFSYV